MGIETLKFFGKPDRDKAGNVISQYPCWGMTQQIDSLEEDIASLKRHVDIGLATADLLPKIKLEIQEKEKQLAEIKRSKPKLSIGERAKLQKIRAEEIIPELERALFTRSDMMFGTANPHEEVKRMTTHCVPISTGIKTLSRAIPGCSIVNDKITRNALSKMFKIISSLLGEQTNVEYLRKDKVTPTYHSKEVLA